MRLFYSLLLFSIGSLQLIAQHGLKPYYADKDDMTIPDLPYSKSDIKHTLYLIGDAGEPNDPHAAQNLARFKEAIDQENKNSTVVFLGDNIYPAGLPTEDSPEYPDAKKAIDQQLSILQNFKGDSYFIPGNHDWNRFAPGGKESVLRQEEYVENYGIKNVKWLPSDGCPGPKVKSVNKDLKFVFVDSQWWLQDWEKEKDINANCDIKTRYAFMRQLEAELIEYRNDQVVVFLHHPLYSNGHHGGRFTFGDHLFPLTDVNPVLYIPLPIIGSIYPVYRKTNGSTQDIPHHNYMKMIEGIEHIIEKHQLDNIIFASGHEHNLQFFIQDDNLHIISGSGSKVEYVGKGDDSEFTLAARGFSKLTFLDNGATWLEFSALNKRNELELVYRKEVVEPLPRKLYNKEVLNQPNTKVDASITAHVTDEFKANGFKQFWLGDQYRDAWTVDVDLPILDISKVDGGLKPVKKGGGFVSNSLRLESLQSGRQYAMRSVNKDGKAAFDDEIQRLKIANIIQDQISAIHPYSATVAAALAEEAGVYHTNPEYVFLKHQNHLDNFNDVYEEQVYLFEERPRGGEWKNQSSFGNPDDIIGFNDLLVNKEKSSKHIVDQKHVLLSRQFDLLIHDWDRHDDQWRWAVFDHDSVKIYRPIPRDRDQTFYKFKGVIPWFAAYFVVKKFSTMKHDLKNPHWQSFNARYFDRDFLNQLTREDWIATSKLLKSRLSDQKIKSAFTSNWNEQLMNDDGYDIIDMLISRRNKLEEISLNLYEYLSKEVTVTGTDGKDQFELSEDADNKLKLSVWDITKKGKKKRKMYERSFDPKETKYLNLYGLEGDDNFVINTSNSSKIKTRIIGGTGDDIIEHAANLDKTKKIEVYDKPFGIKMPDLKGLKDKTSNDIYVNEYDRHQHEYDLNLPIVSLSAFPDNPLLLVFGYTTQKQGWRKSPYKSSHKIIAGVSPSISDYRFDYEMELIDVIGDLNFASHVELNFPRVVNLFGYNGSPDLFNDDADFNRIDLSVIDVKTFLENYYWNDRLKIGLGPWLAIQKLNESEQESSIIQQVNLPAYTFERMYRLGGQANVELDAITYEHKRPYSGVAFGLTADYSDALDRPEDLTLWQLETNISYYAGHKFDDDTDIVLALKAGYGIQCGEAPFYNSLTLGRENLLRGYRVARWRGDEYLAFNADIRLNLFYCDNNVFPFEFGLVAGYDTGRIDSETSDIAHDEWVNSTSFGVWISPLRLVAIHPFLSITDDGNSFNLQFSFQF